MPWTFWIPVTAFHYQVSATMMYKWIYVLKVILLVYICTYYYSPLVASRYCKNRYRKLEKYTIENYAQGCEVIGRKKLTHFMQCGLLCLKRNRKCPIFVYNGEKCWRCKARDNLELFAKRLHGMPSKGLDIFSNRGI